MQKVKDNKPATSEIQWKEQNTNTKRISKINQGWLMFQEEIKGSFSSKIYYVLILIFILPLILTLISFALQQYPTYLTDVNTQFFLNTPYYLLRFSVDGAINTFRGLFSSAMGISMGFSFRNISLATIFYINIPMIAVVAMVCMGIIAADREKGILAIYASKPIYRTEIVIIRYFAFALISLVLTAIVYFSMYFLYAITLLSPSNIVLTGIANTIDMPITFTLLNWFFILAAGSITTFISSIVNRSVIAGVVSIFLLLIITIISMILVMLVGSVAESLKYMDISTITRGLMENNILGYIYWDAIAKMITQAGYTSFFATAMTGRVIDPTIGLAVLVSIIFVPLVSACIITEKREIQ